ncbi:hypothetical protein KUL118_01050 [Tenacibaculum sp. KUL118]|nr:hypothetical protein KUL118_01050 [Tenacibaculum sp. KUL118]
MPEYKPDINVTTAFNNEVIEQSVAFPRQESLFNHITKQIVFLQDEGINQALYKLGYLNPKQVIALKDAYLAAKHNEGGVQRVMGELGRLFDEPAIPSEKPEESAPEVVVRNKPEGPQNEKIPPTVTKMCGSFSEGGYIYDKKPESK